eukprot:s2496_g8.t3
MVLRLGIYFRAIALLCMVITSRLKASGGGQLVGGERKSGQLQRNILLRRFVTVVRHLSRAPDRSGGVLAPGDAVSLQRAALTATVQLRLIFAKRRHRRGSLRKASRSVWCRPGNFPCTNVQLSAVSNRNGNAASSRARGRPGANAPEVTVISWNVLCPQLCTELIFPHSRLQDLDDDIRWGRVLKKLSEKVEENAGDGYMGVAIAFPRRLYDLPAVSIKRVSEALPRHHSPAEGQGHDLNANSPSSWTISRSRQNRMISLRLRLGPDLEQQAFARMPCDVKSDVVVARLEARHEKEIADLEERAKAHVEKVKETAGKGKKAKQAIETAEREVDQWLYDLRERQKEELEELAERLSGHPKEAAAAKEEKASEEPSAEDDEAERARRKKEKAQKKRQNRADKEARMAFRGDRHVEGYAPFAELKEGEDFEGYCGRVESSADWGGELELRALADALKAGRGFKAWALEFQLPRGTTYADKDFVVSTYHMPCFFRDMKVMVIHASLAAQCALEFAGDLPLILAGDFNFRPGSSPYVLLTNGSLPEEHHDHPGDCEAAAEGIEMDEMVEVAEMVEMVKSFIHFNHFNHFETVETVEMVKILIHLNDFNHFNRFNHF